MSRVSPEARYVARLAASRALYREMFTRALDLLPPSKPGRGSERLICVATVAALAKVLSLGRTTVRGDLLRLVNFGWLSKEKEGYVLGHREDGVCFLLADVKAQEEIGKEGVVSTFVLRELVEVKPSSGKDQPAGGRGGARRWRPDA